MTELLPCPFCGSKDLEIGNTHTPIFWVECLDCGAEKSGQHFAVNKEPKKPYSYDQNPLYSCAHTTNDWTKLPKEYQKAFHSAVSAWNTRAKESE